MLAAAGSIVQIEARHAAAINLLIGKSPTPNGGFDKPLTKTQVLAAVKSADQEVIDACQVGLIDAPPRLP